MIVNLVANGMSNDEISDDYSDLETADVQASLHYAAWTAEDAIYRLERVAA